MTDERFKNRKEALTWLQSRGQISTGKFYGDCERGFADMGGRRVFLTIHADKTLSKYQVMEYGDALFSHAAAVPVDLSERKSTLEIRNLELDVEKKELANRKEDEKWLLKDDAWAQMAAIVGKLRDALRHHFHVGQAQLILLAAGDQSRGPEMYEGCEEILARAFNEMAQSGRIETVFDEKGEE